VNYRSKGVGLGKDRALKKGPRPKGGGNLAGRKSGHVHGQKEVSKGIIKRVVGGSANETNRVSGSAEGRGLVRGNPEEMDNTKVYVLGKKRTEQHC